MDGPTVRVGADGIRLAAPILATCDVLFDGQRVLSISPQEAVQQPDGALLIEWPPAIRPYLRGATRVTLRDHLSGEDLLDAEIQFDNADRRVAVVDSAGNPLSLSKWGRLNKAFADGADAAAQIALTQALLRDLNDKVKVTAYAAYGTLLGAVRSGKVIGHDFDSDISYLSEFSHPADIALESFRVERELRALGWTVDRDRLAKLVIRQLRGIDIFVSYFADDRYYLDQWVEGPLRPSQIVPLSTVQIEGYELPAPADPEALLELNYGPNWAVPDPAFHYDRKTVDFARSSAWFAASHSARRGLWDDYWRRPPQPNEVAPSPLARRLAADTAAGSLVLDLGCGVGVDSRFFARQGLPVIGFDFATGALRRARQGRDDLSPKPVFRRLAFADTRRVLAEGARLAARPGQKTIHARLTLDALPPEGHPNFWRFLRMATADGGTAYFEFRAEPGRPLPDTPDSVWRSVPSWKSVRHNIDRIGGTVLHHHVIPAGPRSGSSVPVRRVIARWHPTATS